MDAGERPGGKRRFWATAAVWAVLGGGSAYAPSAVADEAPPPPTAAPPPPSVEPAPPPPARPAPERGEVPRRSAIPDEEREYAMYWAARDWREGDPPPPGYRLAERPWTGMIIGGVIPLGVAYMFSVLGASANDFEDGTAWLTLPVAGPFIAAATFHHRYCDSYYYSSSTGGSEYCHDSDRAVRTILVLDGLVQVTGLALTIWGMESTRHRLVRNDSYMSLRPARLGNGYGFAFSGGF